MKTKTSQIPEHDFEALVLRRLQGRLSSEQEVAAASRLEAAIAAEPDLARVAERIEQAWQGLELPPAQGASVAPLLLARLRGDELRWSLAPNWARATAALALVVGLGAGWGLGLGEESPIQKAIGPSQPRISAGTVPPETAQAEIRQGEAQLATTPLAESFVAAFGGDSDIEGPGFAESLWLAAEAAEPFGGEAQ